MRGNGSDYLMGTITCFGGDKMFWNWAEVMVSHHVNVLNTTKLYTLKQFMLFHVNFTSIERGKDCIGEE